MCRLLAVASASGASLRTLLGEEQCATFLEMSRLHADGWGTAYVPSLRARSLRSVRDPEPIVEGTAAALTANEAMSTDAAARIVHLRMATSGLPISEQNTHPFVVGDRAFAHNGAITPKAELAELIGPAYRAGVEGQTDSELYFALVRQHADATGSLLEGTCRAVEIIRERFPAASLNALILTTTQLLVVHSNERSLIPTRELTASGLQHHELPLNHLDAYFQMSYRRLADGSVVFSSTGIDRTGWTPLTPATVTCVDLDTLDSQTRALRAHSIP